MAPGRHTNATSVIRAAFLAAAAALAGAAAARAETVTVELRNGDRVSGELVERTDEKIVLDHPVFGRLEAPVEKVSPATTHPGLFGTSLLEGWEKDLAIGVAGTRGDTDESDSAENEFDLVASLSVARRTDRLRWRLDGRYMLGFNDKDLDDHNATVTVLRDWLWPASRWFAFAYGLYDFDEFEAWEHRLTVGGGPGRNLYTGPALTLDGRAGPFLTYEFGDEANARPELAAGLFATWKPREWHSLELFNTYFQTVDEGGFRFLTNFQWKIRLDVASAISLKLGIRNEYDSQSEDSENNLRYFTQIAWDL